MLIWVIWVPLTFNKAGPWPGVYRRGFNVLWCQHHYYSRPFHSLPGGSRHYDLMSQAAVITPDYAHFVADICVGSYCIVSMIFICLSTWTCVFFSVDDSDCVCLGFACSCSRCSRSSRRWRCCCPHRTSSCSERTVPADAQCQATCTDYTQRAIALTRELILDHAHSCNYY